MNVLHTSDWHIGRTLYGKKRYEEFTAFLTWVLDTLSTHQVDVLLIAGDIFDTNTPSNRSQELYYQFLFDVAKTSCRHVVVIGGNHDSPSFLEAPKQLLKALNVHVVGAKGESLSDEVILLSNKQNEPEALICAVPYLRDKDIRTLEAGESIDDKNAKMVLGLKQHYAEVCQLAEQQQTLLGEDGKRVPIIGMGHLFAAGGVTQEGDGVRELYVGSLAHVGADIFPSCLDYVALGHLHVPQKVGGNDHVRYSGSPIPMGFGEAKQAKQMVLIQFDGKQPDIRTITIPTFQSLVRIKGDGQEILEQCVQYQNESPIWFEIEYTGEADFAPIRSQLDEAFNNAKHEILRVKNARMMARILNQIDDAETLEDLNVNDVFLRCLDSHAVPDTERDELINSYHTIVQSLYDHDLNAE